MPNMQMLPPGDGSRNSVQVNGRTYTGVVGTPQNVPDFDAAPLEANGWIKTSTHGAGTTAQRPTVPTKGTEFLDTTVGASVIWDGKTWRHHATGASA